MRDYAEGDLAEDKLSQQLTQKCIGPHFYARGDGTRAFYFSEVVLHNQTVPNLTSLCIEQLMKLMQLPIALSKIKCPKS